MQEVASWSSDHHLRTGWSSTSECLVHELGFTVWRGVVIALQRAKSESGGCVLCKVFKPCTSCKTVNLVPALQRNMHIRHYAICRLRHHCSSGCYQLCRMHAPFGRTLHSHGFALTGCP